MKLQVRFAKSSLDFYPQSRIKKIEIFFKNLDQSTAPADKFLEALEIKHVYGQLYSPYGAYIDFKNGVGRKAKPNVSSNYSGSNGPSFVIVENKGIKPNKFQLSGMVYYIESVYSISLIFGGLLFF
ncbi:hypothetical protein [Legionella sainthelensi]|uniref:hypothetical protein n=1 Tax=Legionella sainthelensi TaxID=28087 RepID=UPI000E207D9B|nr:hypothetical protein [Legionella sainthelensi]